jgi:hypothetical protein
MLVGLVEGSLPVCSCSVSGCQVVGFYVFLDNEDTTTDSMGFLFLMKNKLLTVDNAYLKVYF